MTEKIRDLRIYTKQDHCSRNQWYFKIMDYETFEIVFVSEAKFQYAVQATDAGCEKRNSILSTKEN